MAATLQMSVVCEKWPLLRPFAIAHGTRAEAEVVVVTLTRDGISGRGEGVPYARYGETVDSVCAALLEKMGACFTEGADSKSLGLSGAAAASFDAATWDLRCKTENRRAHEVLSWAPPVPLTTAYTLTIATPGEMLLRAKEESHRPILKIKVGARDGAACVAAVRAGAPDAQLIVDANESWPVEELPRLLDKMHELGVSLVEQPLPAGEDDALGAMEHPVPIFSDESFHSSGDVERCRSLYDGVNIKLDKTGGLTKALDALAAARASDLGVMCGCMVGTSLAMAPAFLLAQRADIVDLDAPLLLKQDRPNGFRFKGSQMFPTESAFWG